MNTIKIFLASSEETEKDRREFEIFIGRENKVLQFKGIFLHLEIWEDFIKAISETRLQEEYNKKIEQGDLFVMLFFTKVGMYTSEEFDRALEQFKKAGKPLIYTYFKNAHIKFNDLDRKDANSVWDFQDKLKGLGHFFTEYENDAELKLHFRQQLDKLFTGGHFNFPDEEKSPATIAKQLPKCLSAGEPSIPPEFVGRDIELADIRSKLDKYGLLLVNAEGGMGKTTLAAKYLEENIDRYQHYAWLFCKSGIIEQIKTLAVPLNIDVTKYSTEDEQLLVIKTAMQNLSRPCLLILDNANELEHIEIFQKYFGGLKWHILLTSRCAQVLPKENEYVLNHLMPDQAKILFKTYHDENTAEFESVLDNFLEAIGYNTLLIELFSKNLHKLSALGETLPYAMGQFQSKGLLLGKRSFKITTAYTGNIHEEAPTANEIIEILYDLTTLEENERHILVNLAVMPAESHLLTLLIDVLTPADPISFAKQLKLLARKGWLNSDTASYRISPVVQQIVLAKNADRIEGDAITLVSNLSKKLIHSDGSLANLKNYATAQPFAELARSVTGYLYEDRFDTALLLLNVSDYFKATGNFKASLDQLNKSAEIFEKIDKENYLVCLERLGSIYQQQGEFKKALDYFELETKLFEELFESNPHSESLKNGLAISYEKLGDIYQQQGEFKKALDYFELETKLFEELFESNPHSESLKNGLAISYSKLGDIYQQQGEFKKALDYFELETKLFEELFESNPHSESLKNGLAISYSKLGSIYQQQGEFKKALDYFELDLQLTKELFESNPHSESLKNGLAISYSKLGSIYQQQGEFKKALDYFELDLQLTKELFESNPHSESLKNGLAISYSKLGDIYQQQGEFKKALDYFELRSQLGKELFESNPHSESLKNGLAISYSKLGDIYQQQGEFKKALDYFELRSQLGKELFESNPHSESLKNGLAISYSKLGDIYQQQGEFKKALDYFELETKLFEELFESNPHSESLKNGLAISYSKLGDIYQQQGEFKKALDYFELRSQLGKELFESNPQSVDLYNGLAISYTKLGSIYAEIEEPEKTKKYFQTAEAIWIHLTELVPEMAVYKNNLRWVKGELENL